MDDELAKPEEVAAVSRPVRKAPPRLINSVALDRAVLKAGAEIRSKYLEPLSERAKAERAARLFRAALIPRRQPGRQLSESVKIAVEMRLKGENWQNIYAAALAGFRAMDKYERLGCCANLRRNVNKALRRRAAKTENDLAPVQSATKI
jgi:hypothetical protein